MKTKPTDRSVNSFIEAVENPVRRSDARAVCAMLERVTGQSPRIWGASIIGFGSYDYKYDSGHEGTWARLSFSPRKDRLVLYILTGEEGEAELLARLGKHRTGKGCLYVNKLSDVDLAVLEQLCARSWRSMDMRYPS